VTKSRTSLKTLDQIYEANKAKDMFMDKSVSADTNRSPQIHLDLEQNVTEYTAFPRSKVLNGQEKKDDVLTL
jgi:hypothetical protein